MTSAPTLQPKFLPSRDQLGLVSVGFSGGQVYINHLLIPYHGMVRCMIHACGRQFFTESSIRSVSLLEEYTDAFLFLFILDYDNHSQKQALTLLHTPSSRPA